MPVTHGMTRTLMYRVWLGMCARCHYRSAGNFRYYGGRGIRVCDRWRGRNGFTNFLADMGERPAGMQLDRIDNDGPYSPENCRWATRKQNMRNRSNSRFIEHDGKRLALAEWAERYGMTTDLLRGRLDLLGMPIGDALAKPVRTSSTADWRLTPMNATKSKPTVRPVSVGLPTAARMLDLNYHTVHDMVMRGVFTVLAPNGRGAGKRVYLHTDEVEKYGETRDEIAVRSLRAEKGRLKKGK